MSEPTLEEQIAALQAKLDEAARQGNENRPADPQAQFADFLRDALNASRTPWWGEEAHDDG